MSESAGPVVIAGGSGFIGRRLAAELAGAGRMVTILTRQPNPATVGNVSFVNWTPAEPGAWADHLEGAAAVVNLCGESIAGPRWTESRKARLQTSRVLPSETLVRAINAARLPPLQLLQVSGVGYYGTGEHPRNERAPAGDDYLALLARAWEAPAVDLTIAHAILRLGVVFGKRAGALPRMLTPFRFWVGGPIANGNQWLSWIHLHDVVAAIRHLIDAPGEGGSVYNLTAPNPVRNHEFASTAARLLRRPNVFPLPRTVMQLLLGEQATLVCDGQQVLPTALLERGFQFRYPTVEAALENLIRT